MFGDFTYLQSLETPEKKCNISCRSKSLSSWISSLLKLTEVMSQQESAYSENTVIGILKIPHLILNRIGTIMVLFNANKQKFSNLQRVCILKHSGVPTMTSLPSTLTAKKSTKIKFSADKIYYNFSQEYPKITNM